MTIDDDLPFLLILIVYFLYYYFFGCYTTFVSWQKHLDTSLLDASERQEFYDTLTKTRKNIERAKILSV